MRSVMKWIAVWLLLLAAGLAGAHPANVPSAKIKVAPDGHYVARIRFDAIAFATGVSPKNADDVAMDDLLDGPEADLRYALASAAQRFRREFRALPGGQIDRLDFPTVHAVRRFLDAKPVPRLPVMLTAVVQGHLVPGARSVAFVYPSTFDTVIQTVEIPYREPVSEPVTPGNLSGSVPIPTEAELAQTEADFRAPRTSALLPSTVPPQAPPQVTSPSPRTPEATQPAVTGTPSPPRALPRSPRVVTQVPAPVPSATVEATAEPVSFPRSPFLTYLGMGFTHILPEGVDHILFVLGLFLFGTRNRALLKQITAFTLAHSVTLALAAFDVVRLPGRIIEPVIALSIAVVALENLFASREHRWRTAVVFGFGLIHGLGFAEVFHDAGLRGPGLLTALLSFNLGVELGQCAVVAMALLVFGWFRGHAKYRKWVVVPGSALIAMVALVWTVQRIWG